MTDNNNVFKLEDDDTVYLHECLKWLNKIHHGYASYHDEKALIASYNLFNGIHMPYDRFKRLEFAIEGDNRFNSYIQKIKDDEDFTEVYNNDLSDN